MDRLNNKVMRDTKAITKDKLIQHQEELKSGY